MDSKFQSKFRVLDTYDVKQKTSLFYVQGKSAWALFHGFCSFVLRPVLKVNDQTPSTVILACVAGVRKGRELRARDRARGRREFLSFPRRTLSRT